MAGVRRASGTAVRPSQDAQLGGGKHVGSGFPPRHRRRPSHGHGDLVFLVSQASPAPDEIIEPEGGRDAGSGSGCELNTEPCLSVKCRDWEAGEHRFHSLFPGHPEFGVTVRV